MSLAERALGQYQFGTERIGLFTRGQGSWVWDDSGRKYLDLVCGYGPVVLGHGAEEFNRAISQQLLDGIHLPGYTTSHEQLASLFVEPGTEEAIAVYKSSSEAALAALRLAALVTGRLGVVRCGFLGWLDVEYSPAARWHEVPSSPHRSRPDVALPLRVVTGPNGVTDLLDGDIDRLRELLIDDPTIGAIAVDTYQASFFGVDWLREIIQLGSAFGCATVFDETKLAGRVGPRGLGMASGLHADFTVLGKAIANGAPLSLLVIKEFDSDTFLRARAGGTYSKEVISIAAALATHKAMRDGGYAALTGATARIVEEFNAGVRDADAGDIELVAPLGGGVLDLRFSPPLLADLQARARLTATLAKEGVLMLQGHPSFLATTHGDLDPGLVRRLVANALRHYYEAC